jgi:hypothetical protein
MGQPSLHRMIRSKDKAPICLSAEKVAMCADSEFLVEVDNCGLIVGDSWGILVQQLKSHPINVLNIIISHSLSH